MSFTPIVARLPFRHPERTRGLVAGLAERWAEHPRAAELVQGMVGDAQPGTRAWLQALHRFARDAVRFEPERGEVLQAPGVTILRGAGDCDDKAILIGFAVAVVGGAWRPMLLAQHPQRPGALRTIGPGEPWLGWRPFHIWPQVELGGAWVDVEACHPVAELGEHPADVMRRLNTRW